MNAAKEYKLSDVTTVTSGNSAPQGAQYYCDNGLPFIRAGNLERLVRGEAETVCDKISEIVGSELKLRRFMPDTIVFAKSGMSAKIGRVYKLKNECFVVSHLAAIICGPKVYAPYLLRWFESNPPSRLIPNDAYPSIRLSEISNLIIPLPPIKEQKRIAAVLDKADAIRRKREKAIELADGFLKSVFLDMFGDPVTNPKGWPICTFGEILRKIESGWSPKCHDRAANTGEWGVLKLGAVTSCKYVPTENKALPSELKPRKVLEVKEGDLLFSRKNTYDLVAACAYVFQSREKLMISDLIFRFVINDNKRVLPEYIWGLLTHAGKRKQVQTLAGGAAGSMPNISKAKLLKLKIELPPIDLQHKFANQMHKNFVLINKCCHQLLSSNDLFSSLSQRAFRGDL